MKRGQDQWSGRSAVAPCCLFIPDTRLRRLQFGRGLFGSRSMSAKQPAPLRPGLICPHRGLWWHFQPCSSLCLCYPRWQKAYGVAFPLPISVFDRCPCSQAGCWLHPWALRTGCGGSGHEDFDRTSSAPQAAGMPAGLGESNQSLMDQPACRERIAKPRSFGHGKNQRVWKGQHQPAPASPLRPPSVVDWGVWGEGMSGLGQVGKMYAHSSHLWSAHANCLKMPELRRLWSF